MTEESFTYPHSIESISDVLDIINRPNEYLAEILDVNSNYPHEVAPLGRHHQGTPRPFPHGLWFRGQADVNWELTPSVFRKENKGIAQFYDERDMFTDVRLRLSDADLRGLNNLELMCLMQHHKLPTRLMDWSESPLVAMFFAASPQFYGMPTYTELMADQSRSKKSQKYADRIPFTGDADCSLYVLNAFRLNEISNLSGSLDSNNIFQPQDIDVVLRAVMAEHTYVNSVLAKIRHLDYLTLDIAGSKIRDKLDKLVYKINKIGTTDLLIEKIKPIELQIFYSRLSRPVAVMPKRNHARMDAQLSCFTIHGGKVLYTDVFPEKKSEYGERNNLNYLPGPVGLGDLMSGRFGDGFIDPDQGRYRPFLKKFRISKFAVTRIMVELDRLGISEAMIFQDFENQANFAKRRWATLGGERPILSLPDLAGRLPSPYYTNVRTNVSENDYLKRMYGIG